ncbi:type VI secretion system Vgr family protein, partial [Metapseudomonas otitidis]|uniref:type VI secretion system Vgr family protein n=1 Tax=Metapseudomonas otitidis TaxID=319939 RepID=UPI0013F59BC7
DREGQANEHTSCWLRVASTWAGNAYGAIAIPRIGMEAIITFLEGDPDQPLVTGCLFNGKHRPPYELPAHKTRTLLKTDSSPGGGGYNELRIEDKKGQEQIYLHAQRDWDENIEHDQKIRVGHQRHDRVEDSVYSEFHGEQHHTLHKDRKTELKQDDHLTIGNEQHIRIGSNRLVEAGQEIHLKAGQKLVIEAGMELTLQAGGSFIKLDPGGVTVSGPLAKLNAGGAPGKGSGNHNMLPITPLPADSARPGKATQRAVSEPAPDVIHKLSVQVSPVPGQPGYADEPYTLYADGAQIKQGLTGPGGQVVFEHIPGTQRYAIELINGHRFEVDASQDTATTASSLAERVARQGHRDYQAQRDQLEPLSSSEDYLLASWNPKGKPETP